MEEDRVTRTLKEGKPLDFLPVIDTHCHFGPWSGTAIPHSQDGERIIKEMDRYSLDAAWFSASLPGYGGDMKKANDRILDLTRRYPGRIYLLCTLSANRPEENLDELMRCCETGYCVGVKMHIYNQPPYSLNTSWLQPVFAYLNERRLVFLHHELGDLKVLQEMLRQYPEMTFIEGHINGDKMKMAREWENLYVTTCAGLVYRQHETLIRAWGAEKLLLGSDFGLFHAGFGIGPVGFASVPYTAKTKILGTNALGIMEGMALRPGLPGRTP